MANVQITQLPSAGAITGTEAVPIVQNGVTVQTTTAAISSSPNQTQTFLTVNAEATLANSRYLGVGSGLQIADGGAQSLLQINLIGAAQALDTLGNGFVVKTGASTLANRNITATGSGVAVTNGDGQSGNPVVALAGLPLSLSQMIGTGLVAMNASTTLAPVTIVGTTDQISVANGNASAGNPTIAISSNPVLPGVAGVSLPSGTTANRAVSPPNGTIRYNTDTFTLEGYTANVWNSIAAGLGVTAVTAGTGLDVGAGPQGTITSTGTLNLANTAVTAASYGSATDVGTFTVNAQGQLTAAANVAISAVSIGAVTAVNGTANEITSTGTSTVTLSLPAALTFTGKTVTGGTFTGTTVTGATQTGGTMNNTPIGATTPSTGDFTTLSASVSGTVGGDTITTNTATQTLTNKTLTTPIIASISNTGLLTLPTSTDTLVGRATTDTLTNKTISGVTNTLSNIGNASLTNSSVTYNGVTVALGASGTITANTTNPLTIGTGLSGTSYNGSSAVTIAIDSTVATLTGTQTLTNKTISGSNNTLSNIGNASLTNSSLTVGTTAIALGASSLTLGGLTSVAVTQDPVSALELATKQYVDAVAQGLDPKASCVVATTANITLSGTQTIDSVVLIAGDRCLVKDQTLSQDNGIYLVASGAWTRATDMDTWAEVPGAFTFIEQGTLYADTGWVCTSNAGGTLGTTPITWVQFAGVGSYTAGTGLTLTGTQFSLTVPVPVALGGTNATNATDARTNLVAAKSGTNSDITELYALNGTSYGVAYQNLTNQLVMGAVLTFDGTTLTAPDAAFTTLTASSTTTLSGLTASTALALNASKQVVSVTNTGTGNNVLATSPILVTPDLGTPTALVGTNISGTASALNIGGTAAVATTTTITSNSTNANNYLAFVNSTSGNLSQLVNSSITCNPSTGNLTGGVSGGTF